MRTRFGLKTHTAILICLAFVFRLLFVNISLLSTRDTRHTQHNLKSHLAQQLKKRRRSAELNDKAAFQSYSALELCMEESDDEEDHTKHASPFLLTFIGALIHKIQSTLLPNGFFDRIKCRLQPKKYLALSILRI